MFQKITHIEFTLIEVTYTFNAYFKDFTETINRKPSLKIGVLIYPDD